MNEKKAITKKALELGASYSKVYFKTVTFTDIAQTKVRFLYFHNLKWLGANGWSELKKYAVVEHNVIIGSKDAGGGRNNAHGREVFALPSCPSIRFRAILMPYRSACLAVGMN